MTTTTKASLRRDTPGRPDPAATTARPRRRILRRNPWGHPWFLEGFTWLYLIWSLVPIAIAVLFSFNKGKSQATWQGFSWRWYFKDPVNSVLHNPALHAAVIQTVRLSVLTTVIAVPLGVAFALGINRWKGPVPATFNFVMILSFVIPELIFGVAMFFVFTELFTTVHLGTTARSWPWSSGTSAGPRSSSRPGWSPSAASTRRPPPTWAPTACRPCAGSCCRCSARPSSPARYWSSPA